MITVQKLNSITFLPEAWLKQDNEQQRYNYDTFC